MEATTIKIENPLLNQLNKIKPGDKSFSAFAREILKKEVLRRRLIEAADRYTEFLDSTSSEAEWLADWEKADLAHPPKQRGQK